MLPVDQERALHLLQQKGPATGSLAPIPLQLPYYSPTRAATLTAQTSTETLAAAAASTASRDQQAADFTTDTGIQAHAAAIAADATEEEAAQAAQAAAGAALTTTQAAIAGADATPHRLRRRGPHHQHQDHIELFSFFSTLFSSS